MRFRLPQADPRRRGVVLIAVLVVIVLLTLAAYQYSELMLAEYKAASSFARAAQARAAAEAGVNYAAMLLADRTAYSGTLNGNPWDNTGRFQAVPVGGQEGGARKPFFSIIAPLGPDELASTTVPFRYGCTDEASKINLNSLLKLDSSGGVAVQILGKLGIPEDTANAILDWIDTDSTPRSGGAEDEYYSLQGYKCKNAPLDTLEELLRVRGVTPELLFGNDKNRNGILDPEETSTGDMRDLGWQAYLTVYSREQNIDSEGNARLYINTRNTLSLYQKLVDGVGQDMANYLLAYRRYGPAPANLTQSLPRNVRILQAKASDIQRQELGLISGLIGSPGQSIPSLFQLIGTEVVIRPRDQRDTRTPWKRVACPLNDPAQQRALLPKVLDKLTTTDPNQDLTARVNVNTAPQGVLMALPGLTEADVQAILSARPTPSSLSSPDPIYQTPAWLITEARLPPNTLRTMERFITARTQVYRVQSVGHFEKGGPTVRVEAIIDTNRGRPRIVYWRDLSELGRGFDLSGMTGGAP
jgi:type II secretory pathway component PulK